MNKSLNDQLMVRATFWYTISNIVLRGISIFTAPIFTRLLSTADYGKASNFSTWANILSCFTGLSLATAALRGKVEYKDGYKKFLSSVQTLRMIIACIISVFMIIYVKYFSSLMKLSVPCVFIMVIYLIFEPSVNYAQIDYQFDYKYKENLRITYFTAVTTVIISIVCIQLCPFERYIGRILGISLPSIILGIYFSVKILKQGKTGYNKVYWEYSLKLSLPMIPHSLSMIVLGQIDRSMIVKYCGESKAGIYSFGYSYAVLLAVLTNAISDGIKPKMYVYLEEGKYDLLAGFMKRIVYFVSLLSMIQIAAAPEILKILGTEEFYDARWVVFPVVAGTLMQFMYQNFNIVQLYYKKTIFTAIGSVSAAIFNYILNMLFIPEYGYITAAYTTLASYGMLMIFHYLVSCRVAKRKVYRFFPYAVSSIAVCMIGMLYNSMYDYTIELRYAGIMITCIIGVIMYKNEISSYAKIDAKRHGK